MVNKLLTMRHIFSIGMTAALLVLSFTDAPSARALEVCTCLARDTQDDRDRAYAVFSGTVRRIERRFSPDRTEVTFDVQAVWKRVKTQKYAVWTQGSDVVAMAREGLTCGYTFESGETYLVFAYRNPNDNGLAWVSNCGHTKKLREAYDELAELGKPRTIFKDTELPRATPRDFTPTPLLEATPLPELQKLPGIWSGEEDSEDEDTWGEEHDIEPAEPAQDRRVPLAKRVPVTRLPPVQVQIIE